MNSIGFDLHAMLHKEREAFIESEHKYHYEKHAKTIDVLSELVKIQMVKEKSFLKKREENPEWFDVKKENYELEKADNLQFLKFPEPDYFTTRTKYYEYASECTPCYIYSTNDKYNSLLALSIKQSKLENIYDLLEKHRGIFHGDFDERMYNLNIDYSYLFSQETQIVLYNWGRGVPKNHPKIFERVAGWENDTTISMYAFEEEEMEELDKSISKEMDALLDYMTLPTRDVSYQMDNFPESEVLIPPLGMDREKVNFEIEMKSIFITEERNWGSRKKYTKKQMKYLQSMISIVQDFLCQNKIILQSKNDDPPYFWNNNRNWKKDTEQRRKDRMFTELNYFISGDNIYYYYAEYSHVFEPNDNPSFQLFFAFRLRQMLLEDLEAFLKEKREQFSGDFLGFLDVVLVEYDCLFSKKTKRMVDKWKQKISLGSKQAALNIINLDRTDEGGIVDNSTLEDKEEKSFLETIFLKPPSGYVQVEGKLREQQIKKFLSFLYLENNGSKDGLPFLSEEKVKEVFRYGLAYPEPIEETKKFSLNIDKEKRIKSIIGLMFYHLYVKNEPRAPLKNYKNEYARFLRSYFDDFSESETSTRHLLRSTVPAKLNKKKFDFQKYISFLD